MTSKQFKDLRLARKETQAEFALALGVTITTVNRRENGHIERTTPLLMNRIKTLADEIGFKLKD